MANRFLQIHRRLLFHWTKPPGKIFVPNTLKERELFVDHLLGLLVKGLRVSTPKISDHEYIVKGEIEAERPMICFTESIVGEAGPHARRYGSMGLGFTRKFVMAQRGRPVIYLDKNSDDLFTKSVIQVLQAALKGSDAVLRAHAKLISGWLKSYNMPRVAPQERGISVGVSRKQVSREEDDVLRLKFGGLRSNLEDREWRIVYQASASEKIEEDGRRIPFVAGELALLVLPDHQTLSIALRRKEILDRLHPHGKPAVCAISREMLPSIHG
jgi:Putative abortive phage resistance protein AbiGi, antitoxin